MCKRDEYLFTYFALITPTPPPFMTYRYNITLYNTVFLCVIATNNASDDSSKSNILYSARSDLYFLFEFSKINIVYSTMLCSGDHACQLKCRFLCVSSLKN